MAVTYNKINWDEVTPITVANLDRIDVGIDEVVTQANSNESRITTNEDDISNIEDGTTKVQSASQADNATEADNSQTVRGLYLELVDSGSVAIDDNSTETITLNMNVSDNYIVQSRGRTSLSEPELSRAYVTIEKGFYDPDDFTQNNALRVTNNSPNGRTIIFEYEIYVIR